MRIMIVDDNQEMRKVIAEMLNTEKNEITELEDGEESVEQYDKIKPDWVFMDIKMKRMHGLEAVKRIKDKFPNAHIAVVSKYDDKFFRIFASKVGAEKFISKQNLIELKTLFNKKLN